MKEEVDETLLMGMPVNRVARLAIGIQEYTPSEGSIMMPCANCWTKVYVGPRQQAFLEAHPEAKVMCWLCGVAKGGEQVVKNLGGKGGTLKLTDGTEPK